MDTIEYLAGAGPNGLSDIYEIKILICYLMNYIKKDISKQMLNSIFFEKNIVNYFNFCEALSQLINSKHISIVNNITYYNTILNKSDTICNDILYKYKDECLKNYKNSIKSGDIAQINFSETEKNNYEVRNNDNNISNTDVHLDNITSNTFGDDSGVEICRKNKYNTLNDENNSINILRLEQLGIETAQSLAYTISPSIRKKVINAALNLLSKYKIDSDYTANINKTIDGYEVECCINDFKSPLLKFTFFAPDRMQASIIVENFKKNPACVYKSFLASLTNDPQIFLELYNECLKNTQQND